MKSIIIASLIALAFAATPATFVPKNEYVYKFDGLILSGLSTSASETSQTRIQCQARLQLIDDRAVHLQLSKIHLAASHLPESEQWPRLESMESRELSDEHKQLLESPVRAQLRNGLISEIQFSNEDAEWSKNLKRSILNLISLRRTAPVDEITEEPRYEENDNQFFTVHEKTIEGDCQVAYTILNEDKQTVITKSVNFEKCISRPEISYGLRFTSQCEECQELPKQTMPKTVYTYTIKNDKLQQVDVHSTYVLDVNGEQIVKSEIRSKLVLEEERKTKNEIKKVNGEKEDIVYSARWEQLVEEFFKNGDKAETLPFEEYPTERKMEQLRNIIEQIEQTEQNKPETAHLLARLVRLFRMCTIEELKTIHTTVYTKAEKKVQYILDSAFAISGTKNTIQHLIHHIEKKSFTPLRAAQLLKSVQETQYPSERIADLLIELARSQIAKEHEVIRQSAWLAAGSVVRGVVSQTEDLPLIRENRRETKEKFVRVFMQHFRQAETTYEKVLALKTIGNAGIDLSAFELADIIRDHRQPLALRIEAVDALRLLKDIMPRKIQTILLPVYKSRQNAPELRMAALWRIMHTIPDAPVLTQIVAQMEQESNQHVAAFTYNVIRKFSKSTNPCYAYFATRCSKIILFTRYQPQEQLLSTYSQLPIFNTLLHSGIQFDFASIFEKNSFLPKETQASLETVFGGNWNKYLAQVGFSQQNFDQVIVNALERFSKMNGQSELFQSRKQAGVQLLKELAKKMNIRARVPAGEERSAHAVFYLRYKDMDYVVLPIEKETINRIVDEYVQNGKLDLQSIRNRLNKDQGFELHHAAFVYEATRKMPTSLGLPLTISGKAPTVMSVEGKVIVELKQLGARFILNARPSIVSTHVTQMRFWTPLFEQGVKSLQTIRAFIPLKLESNVEMKNSQLELATKFVIPQEKLTLALHTRPVAFLRFPTTEKYEHVEAEEKTIVVPQWQLRSEEVERFYEVLGLKVAVRGNYMNQWNVPALLLSEQNMEVTVESLNRAAEFVARLNVANFEKTDLSEINFNTVFEKEFETEDRETENRRQQFQKMIREIQSEKGYKLTTTLKLEAPQDNYVKTELRTVCDKQVRICKLEIDARRSPVSEQENKEWALHAELIAARPQSPATLQQLRQQPHREVQLALNAKWGSNKKNEININAQLQQSTEQKNIIRSFDREYNGLPEYELLVKAARLNQLNAVSQYKLTQETEAAFSRFFDYVKVYNFWTVSEKWANNEPRRATLQLTVEPTSRQFLNLTLETPEQRVVLKNARIPRTYLPTIAQRTVRQQVLEKTGASCKVDNSEVKTFDEMIYRAPLTTCYSVIAKDCSEEPQFAVLAKKLNKKSDNLSVKVIREGQELIVEKRSEEFLVKLGSKKLTTEQLEKYEIETLGDNLIVIRLPEGEVRFDGYTIKTVIPSAYTNAQLCGLCGNNDGESENEYYTADNYKTEDVEEFHRSFILKDDDCEIENDRLSEKKNYQNKWNKSQNQKYESEYESEQYNNEDNEENALVKKTAIKEFPHRVCFSIEPVQECRKGMDVEKTVSKKVRYTCMPRHSSEARRLLKEAREEVVPLNEYPVSFVEAIKMPVACVA